MPRSGWLMLAAALVAGCATVHVTFDNVTPGARFFARHLGRRP